MNRTVVTTLALLSVASLAQAGGVSTLQPKPLPVEKTTPKAPVEAQPTAAQSRIKGPALAGVLVTTLADTAQAGAGIALNNLPEANAAKLEAVLKPFLGKPITQALLTDMTRAIVLYYKRDVHLIVDIIAPAGQDITKGNVKFVVVKAKLGKMTVVGTHNFKAKAIANAFTTRPGDAINAQTMLEDLDWANRNPFHRTNLLYRRGAKMGETDVVLQTADQKPYRLYAGMDDTGTRLTGDTRLYTGFNLGNVFSAGKQLNYQFTGSQDMRKMRSHAFSYTDPLPWRHVLTLNGSYQQLRPDVSYPMRSDGFSYDVGADYTVPLHITQTGTQDVSVGYEFKRSNNNLEFGGTQVFATTVDVAQWNVAHHLKQEDALGDTTLTTKLVVSPGEATDKNSDVAQNISRAGASADYVYGTVTLQRTTLLPGAFSLVTSAQLQRANTRLPGSEELSIGGINTVRGYAEGETSGDNGFVLRNELRAPALSPLGNDALVLLGFVDYGTVSRNNVQSGETRNDTLLSVGPGLRYRLGRNVDMRADYGVQLHSEVSDVAQRAHIGLTPSY